MPTLEEVVEALERLGLKDAAEDAKALAKFAEEAARLCSGKVEGYALKVFPGAFVLNIYIDVGIVVGKPAKIEVDRMFERADLVFSSGERRVNLRDYLNIDRYAFSVEGRGAEMTLDWEGKGEIWLEVEPGDALLITLKPSSPDIWVTTMTPERLRKHLEAIGISVPD